jgi:hypothetical protein
VSHFYGKLIGKGETPRTITGTPNSGLVAEAMGMKGKIYVHVYEAGGVDYFEIFLENNDFNPNKEKKSEILARGVLDSDYLISGSATTLPAFFPSAPATQPA